MSDVKETSENEAGNVLNPIYRQGWADAIAWIKKGGPIDRAAVQGAVNPLQVTYLGRRANQNNCMVFESWLTDDELIGSDDSRLDKLMADINAALNAAAATDDSVKREVASSAAIAIQRKDTSA